MKIVVCVKQVPDTKGGVKFKPDGTLDRGAMLAIMNPDDKAGLEAIEYEKLEDAIRRVFARKGDAIVEANIKALALGREAQK